jgi:hypothetical protein
MRTDGHDAFRSFAKNCLLQSQMKSDIFVVGLCRKLSMEKLGKRGEKNSAINPTLKGIFALEFEPNKAHIVVFFTVPLSNCPPYFSIELSDPQMDFIIFIIQIPDRLSCMLVLASVPDVSEDFTTIFLLSDYTASYTRHHFSAIRHQTAVFSFQSVKHSHMFIRERSF